MINFLINIAKHLVQQTLLLFSRHLFPFCFRFSLSCDFSHLISEVFLYYVLKEETTAADTSDEEIIL